MALLLQHQMQSVANLKIIDMLAGGDIDTEVFGWIAKCDAFLVFGTQDYGEDTGNQACTFYEYKFAFSKKKPIILHIFQ